MQKDKLDEEVQNERKMKKKQNKRTENKGDNECEIKDHTKIQRTED